MPESKHYLLHRRADLAERRDLLDATMSTLAKLEPVRPEDVPVNPSGIVILKTDTTGLSPYFDEVLHVTCLDGSGRLLLDSPVRTHWNFAWPEAEKLNHISPQDVAKAPTPEKLSYSFRAVLASAKTLVGYNLNTFERLFLQPWHVLNQFSGQVCDLMPLITKLHGVINPDYGDQTQISLPAAVRFYEASGYAKYFPPKETKQHYPNNTITKAEDIAFLLKAVSHDPAYQHWASAELKRRTKEIAKTA